MRSIIFIAVLLISTLSFGQTEEKPFNQWALELELGGHSLVAADYYGDDFIHVGVLARHNFNRTFGLGLRVGLDAFEVTRDSDDSTFNGTYTSLNLEAIVDLFDVVSLHSEKFTILAHGGPGVAFTKDTFFNLSGGFTGLYKIGQNSAVKLDYTMHGNYNQGITNEFGVVEHLNGLSTIVNTFSVGVAFYLGDKPNHADWHPDECCGGEVIIHQGDTTIVNNYQTLITKVIKETYEPVLQEFVFFNHDSDKINKKLLSRTDALNAIYQTYNALELFPNKRVLVIGWASATSSSEEYNQALSERRCMSIRQKLLDMGIEDDRILIDSYGKDYHLDKENVHDLARRIEMRIVD